jgi:hypothetical protein
MPPSSLNLVTGIQGVSVLTPGSAGNLVLNDCATLAAASIANQLASIPYNQVPADLNFPVQNGLVISGVPTGMVLAVVYNIYVPRPPTRVRQMALNISAPSVITPPSPLNAIAGIVGFNTLIQGTAGNLVFNDAATLAAASAANEFFASPYEQQGGSPINWPVQSGLVVSQVPAGGVFSILYEILVAGG